MSELFVGCKVVWIGPVGKGCEGYSETTPKLSRDEIYTIRWIGQSAFLNTGFLPGVRIEERTRTFTVNQFDDWPFFAHIFRPIKSDPVEIFRKIARDVPVRSRKDVISA